MNTEKTLLSARLRALRQAQGSTQQAVARTLGIDRTTYAKYESGANEPPIPMLIALATHFSVTVDYLIGRADAPQAETPLPDYTPVGAPPPEDLSEAERQALEAFIRLLLTQRRT